MISKPKFTLIHRLIHWVLVISMCIVVTTALLRMGWMEKHHLAHILSTGLAKIDTVITKEQAVVIAKSMRNVMFDWHYYAGYALGVSLALRFIYIHKSGWQHTKLMDKEGTVKEKLQSMLYIVFYVCTTYVVLSGLSMLYLHDWTPVLVKTLHKAALWYVIPFFVFHLIGMLLEDYRQSKKSIISKMFFG